jgi:VCBS repeat-containing protein
MDEPTPNNLPEAQSSTVTTSEDAPYIFSAADFNFTDLDGDEILSITIQSLTSIGSLKLNDVDVTVGQTINIEDINLGLLIFNPIQDENGLGYDEFGFTVNDADIGVVSALMTIDVIEENDPAIISPAVINLDETDAPLSATGVLTSSDVDNADNAFTPSSTVGTIGTFDIDANGNWIFTANDAYDHLNVGDSVNETFHVTSIDGTPGTVEITINGTNDEATVSSAEITLIETDAALSASGTLTSSDVDNNDNEFVPGNIIGAIGVLEIDVSGNWTFTANDTYDNLNVGDFVNETFNVTSADGTPSSVQITIDGTNDAATISSIEVALDETDSALFTSGTLTSIDVDNADNAFTPSNTVGTIGTFSVDANGNWTFTANDAYDYLNVGDSVNDTFHVTSVDGTPGTVEITINGTNDAATVSSAAITLIETDVALSASGTLTSSDVDNEDNVFTVGSIGTFSIDANGNWSFVANDAFDHLNVGDSVNEIFNVTSADGTPSSVQITINGTNDAAVVSSDVVSVDETDAPIITSGTLTSIDVDNADNAFTPSTTVGTIGTFDIDANGNWTFTAHEAFDYLNVDESINEMFHVASEDGTPGTVRIFINGTNDMTPGPDILRGDSGDDVLDGLGGNDLIYGRDGNDSLIGNIGDDYLNGGSGSDNYFFDLGWGRDTLSDYDPQGIDADTITFGAGINQDDIAISRESSHLAIIHNNTDDKISVINWFNDVNNNVEQIVFNDGTVWDKSVIESKLLLATEENDTLSGMFDDDVIDGLGGDDTIYGSDGDDTLIGNFGNDHLLGEAGSDTYVFNLGWGYDTISDYEGNSLDLDVISFGPGIFPADIVVSRSVSDLVLKHINTSDHVVVSNWFNGSDTYRIEQIIFNDGTVWDSSVIQFELLNATENDDGLSGASNNDVIDGLGGDDDIYGGEGDDVLIGNIGNDSLFGESGSDTYTFDLGWGQDTITDYDQDNIDIDKISFGSGINPDDIIVSRNNSYLILKHKNTNDQISISSWFFNNNEPNTSYRIEQIEFNDGTVWGSSEIQSQLLSATEGNDGLSGTAGDDVIDGLGGNDFIYGSEGNDTITGGNGNDSLYGGSGNDTYNYNPGWGQDVIQDDGGSLDVINFGPGIIANNIKLSRSGSGLFLKHVGTSDQILVSNFFNDDEPPIEQIQFDDGTVWGVSEIQLQLLNATEDDDGLSGTSADDIIDGLGGNDFIYGDDGDDVLTGNSGNDALFGGSGNDTYTFELGWGQDNLHEIEDGLDTISFGSGINPNDVEIRRTGLNLVIEHQVTNDQITIWNWFANSTYQIEQITFNDGTIWDNAVIHSHLLNATEGDDGLSGTPGDDVIDGLGGNDIIYSGEGNDTITGGSGNDSLNGEDGSDTYVFESGWGQDTIYDYDINEIDTDTIIFSSGINPNDIKVERSDINLLLTNTITDDQIIIRNWFSNSSFHIEQFIFNDGTTWNTSTINSLLLSATDGDDGISGTSGDDVIDGLGGNDTIYGSLGNDTLIGNTGNDRLHGESGNDTYVFNLGWGFDQIIEGGESIDTISFGEGINPGDILMRRSSVNLILKHQVTGDQITVSNHFYSANYRIEQIEFNDGTIWDSSEIESRLLIATEGDDGLSGTVNDDIINGLGGNDFIYGGNGNDTLIGGDGDDSLYGEEGNDTYSFNPGWGQDTIFENNGSNPGSNTITFGVGINSDDILITRIGNYLVLKHQTTNDQISVAGWFNDTDINYYIDQVVFADGTIWDRDAISDQVPGATDGNDFLSGTDGNDIIDGLGGNDSIVTGNGDDVLIGGAGNDQLNGGSGNDTYVFEQNWGQDTLSTYNFPGNDINIIVFGDGIDPDDIQLSQYGGFGWDLLISHRDTNDQIRVPGWFFGGITNRIDQIEFNDGTVWDTATIEAMLLIATEGNDVISGTEGDDIINGLGGNDSIYGNSGNDILNGGAGNDFLKGFYGNNTYVFEENWGQDSIWKENATNEKIVFGAGISPDDLRLNRNGSDLLILHKHTSDRITSIRWFTHVDYQMESIEFADGTIWNRSDIEAQLLIATENDDALSGTDNDDVVDGLGGNDTIYGSLGNDSIDGGSGNDTIYGDDNYNPTYVGDDVINGGAGDDSLLGGPGSDAYIFEQNWGQDTITDDGTYGSDTDIDKIIFGVGIDPGDINLSRNNNDLLITHQVTNDQIIAKHLFGNPDRYNIEQIEFADGTVWGSIEIASQLIVVTEGDDNITGTIGDDVIDSLGGNDLVYGQDGNDSLSGGEGNDTLHGEAGNDILAGGTGNDTLYGAAGNDTYFFEQNWGQDTIQEYDATGNEIDTISFGVGIGPDDIQLSRSISHSNALELTHQNTSDRIIVSSWFVDPSLYRIEQIEFADGTVWDIAAIEAQLLIATEGDDILSGAINDDVIDGLGGNDYIFGDAGNDTLIGGEGDDNLRGNDGNDILIGGEGNDSSQGGFGNDTYVIEQGWGQDIIVDWDYTAGNIDTVVFGSGISSYDISVSQSGNNLILTQQGASDQLTLRDWFTSNDFRIEQVQFSDGTVWDHEEIDANTAPITTVDTYLTDKDIPLTILSADLLSNDSDADSDTLEIISVENAVNSNVIIDATGDIIFTPDAEYVGNASFDYVVSDGRGGIVSQTVSIEIVNNNVAPSLINNSLTINEGQTVILNTANLDILDPDNASSELNYSVNNIVGGQFELVSSPGIAIVNFTQQQVVDGEIQFVHDGNESAPSYDITVSDGDLSDSSSAVIVFNNINDPAVVSSDDVNLDETDAPLSTSGTLTSIDIDNDDNVFTVSNTVGSIGTFAIDANGNWTFDANEAFDSLNVGDSVSETYNVTSVDGTPGAVKVTINGTPENVTGTVSDDDLTGTSNDDHIDGGDGNDTINGNEGNDIIIGGLGQDILRGGLGDDTFLFSGDEGDYNIVNGGEGNDSLLGSAGDDVFRFNIFNGQNTVETIDGAGGNDVIVGTSGNNHFDFANTTLSNISSIDGGAGNDRITGSDGDDVIRGGLGQDILQGDAGDDTFLLSGDEGDYNIVNGGDGNDSLLGSAGDDVFRFNIFNGQNTVETIDGAGGNDVIVGTSGNNHFDFANTTLNNISSIDGGAGNDRITGSDGDDVISGGLGQDTLFGGAGNDTFLLSGDEGDYNIVNGGDGNDSLLGSAGDDVFRFNVFNGQNTVETIDGAGGNDVIVGTSGNNHFDFAGTTLSNISSIDGGAGNDTITGSDGDDVIIGGLGLDSLRGGAGDDTYLFNLGDEVDTLLDSSGTNDNVVFNQVSHDQLWFWRTGNHLNIGIVNTEDKLTIQNWFSSPDAKIEAFNTSDDSYALYESNVQQLVDAMAAFSAPASGSLDVPQTIQDDVQSVITTAWQTA